MRKMYKSNKYIEMYVYIYIYIHKHKNKKIYRNTYRKIFI